MLIEDGKKSIADILGSQGAVGPKRIFMFILFSPFCFSFDLEEEKYFHFEVLANCISHLPFMDQTLKIVLFFFVMRTPFLFKIYKFQSLLNANFDIVFHRVWRGHVILRCLGTVCELLGFVYLIFFPLVPNVVTF